MTLGGMEQILRHGRVFFIYDTERCRREEDDPEEALCFLEPRLGGDDAPLPPDALHLVCQLMGAALFTERNMGTFPDTVQLQHGEFVLFRDGRFVWAMHTSGEDSTSVTRQRLLRTRRALRLLLGGPHALSEVGRDRLARCLRPLLASGPPPLHVLFGVSPRLDWAQKDEFMGRQLAELQVALARLPGALTCVLCWNGQAISTGSIESIEHLLIHIYHLPEGALTPAAEVVPPAGALAACVHLEPDVYSRLRETAQPHWCQSTPRPSVVCAPSLLASIEERAESRTATTSSGTGTAGSPADAADRTATGRQRHRRRRQGAPAAAPSVAAPAELTAPVPAAPPPLEEDGSEDALCSRIGALALRALSAECGRRSPERPPPLEQIPVRRLRRAPRRRHNSARRRSLSDLDVPEPCSNLAFLKRHEPELYRQELRTLQAGLRDNAPTFSPVAANAYSFGIPRSNRLYTPRAASAGSPSPPRSAGLSWRRWRSAGGTGYCSEAAATAAPAPAPARRRRFHSEGEEAGWRPRQLTELLRHGEGEPRPAPQPDPEPTPATLYVKTCGKLKCFVLLETHEATLQSQIEELDRVCSGGLEGLEVMLESYRSIPSFHDQHYSYCSWRAPTGSRPAQLEAEGAPQLDLRLVQMLHSDLQQGRITDCRIRTPSDVVLAQRSGSSETFYQQPTSGHQHGLPVVNGPLSRLDERAQQRLSANHRLRLAS